MFDIGASELLLTVIVAIVVIGPKDLPRALRIAGGWLGKMRRMSGHFRSGIEEMIRQAELQDMEKKWLEKNAAIMQQEAQAEPVEVGADERTDGEPAQAASGVSHQTPGQGAGGEVISPELPLASPKAQS